MAEPSGEDLGELYRRYNATCNAHQAHFLGLAATGRLVRTQEFAVYRFAQGRIVEVWVTADNLGLLDQLRHERMS